MTWEACILAGGQSRRMGCDKAALPLGTVPMLDRITAIARSANLSVRVIREDLEPGLGPLGGVVTALAECRTDGLLVLACDMPFITPRLLQELCATSRATDRPVFCSAEERPGFPFALPIVLRPEVEQLVTKGTRSIRQLFQAIKGLRLPSPAHELFNCNTPEEWQAAQETFAREAGPAPPRA